MYRIFIVEDDDIISGKVAQALQNWGFETAVCEDFRQVTDEMIRLILTLFFLILCCLFSTDITGAAKYENFLRCLSCFSLQQEKI